MQTITLEAKTRSAKGPNATVLRKEQMIPAVMYGHGVEAQSLAVPFGDFRKVYLQAGMSSLVDVNVDGKTSVKALIKDVQIDPLTMHPIHIDFHQVNMKEKMTANVPLVFIGESAAVKVLGGTLVKSLDHVEVECLPMDLPHAIEVDLSALATFDDMISIGSLKLPKGVEVLNEPEGTVATVDEPLTEDEMKKLEESQLGDVTAVKSEAELKKEAAAAQAATETEANATKS
ncbi:MAG: 50S ribosomal protein L25 [Candidatus Moranbacteria bacterium]|nr:50S ribosomal protein L25 [Candidatus Moranbacteria bacterium]